MAQNVVEKIVQRFAVGMAPGEELHSGDFVTVKPLHVMTHDNSGAVIKKFRSLGAKSVADATQPVFCLDHDVQNTSPENLKKYGDIEGFAAEHGIAFHPAGRGIGHQIMAEEGFARPGALVVGSDSHSNLYGALGALGTPVVRTDAAAIWATGTTWWQIPPVARVELVGTLGPGVRGKDVILSLIGLYANDELLNHAVEFTGPAVTELSMDQRMTISNMTTEWGVLAGLFPFDDVLEDYLRDRAARMESRGDASPRITPGRIDEWAAERAVADADAQYAAHIEFDLSRVSPHVAGPDQVKVIAPVAELAEENIAIQKAYLLSCVNGRLEDLREAADVLKGGAIPDGVELYVAAASSEIESAAKADGTWDALVDAGARMLPPGCGPCIGLGEGTLGPDEVGISATNRNFKGRMGDRSAKAYLASPAVVAASALAGRIVGPDSATATIPEKAYRVSDATAGEAASGTILEGFPERLGGRLLLLPQDNLNTDGIYGKDWTYRDDMSPPEMAEVAMLNYDPAFQDIAREGDIIVGAQNFGTGSSREQAATALKFRGIQLVIAASFSETYKRNAFNNGYIVLDSPGLVQRLRREQREAIDAGTLTIPCEGEAVIDFAKGSIEYGGESYPMSRLSPTAQELILAGGSEGLVRQRLGG